MKNVPQSVLLANCYLMHDVTMVTPRGSGIPSMIAVQAASAIRDDFGHVVVEQFPFWTLQQLTPGWLDGTHAESLLIGKDAASKVCEQPAKLP